MPAVFDHFRHTFFEGPVMCADAPVLRPRLRRLPRRRPASGRTDAPAIERTGAFECPGFASQPPPTTD